MERKLLGFSAALVGVLGLAAFLLSPEKVSSEAIESSVVRAPDLIESAWSLPVASTFGRTVAWQSNGSLCGPASVANAFRSIGEEETTEHDVLEGTGLCWTGFCVIGLTLDELAGVAQLHTERKVTVLRDLTAEEFKQHLRRSNDPGVRYIINFTRKSIFGAGGGHHSPIGGYLEDKDLVFVLDVNRAFQPWLIERERLFAAMDTLDGDKKRGLLLIE